MSQVVRIHEYGSADVLRIDDIDVPAPAADEVQIRVKAIGLNRAEVMFRNGAYLQEAQFPSRLGYEAAGMVEAVGSAVSGFTAGDAVSVVPPLDIARWGTRRAGQRPARLVVKHPQALGFETAAAVWISTSPPGAVGAGAAGRRDSVIITAASSSVGLAAIQIANAVGATPIAVTRGPGKRQALLDAAAHVIATQEQDLAAEVARITGGAPAWCSTDRWPSSCR